MTKHLDTGRQGEEIAEAYLREKGYRVLGRNISNPHGKRLGEIDIVAEKKRMVVFVEVKTRILNPNQEDSLPEHQVTRSKLIKLERIASYYLRSNSLETREYRFDVVSVILKRGEGPAINHLESVFFS